MEPLEPTTVLHTQEVRGSSPCAPTIDNQEPTGNHRSQLWTSCFSGRPSYCPRFLLITCLFARMDHSGSDVKGFLRDVARSTALIYPPRITLRH